MAELDNAITQLDAEITKLGFPKENTIEWYVLRAKSTGASLLRAIRMKNLTPVEAEVFRKGVRFGLMDLQQPDAIELAHQAYEAEAAKPAEVVQ